VTLQLGSITFDCDDTLAVARFWSAVLDRPVDPDPTPFFASIGAGAGAADGGTPSWFFAKVPEPKTAKNRCHVDLHAESREAVATEVDRLTALGATMIRPPKEEWGTYWATLHDPEGNEFCIGAD
jgi:predicted enzyme related to lactoylglutathione lyase